MNVVNKHDSPRSKSAAGLRQDLSANDSINIGSQIRMITLIVLSIFFGEALVMFILNFLPAIPAFWEAFFDAALLIVLISPVLYFGLFRSLIGQLEERITIQRKLEKHRDHLEESITARTEALTAVNENLTQEIKNRGLAQNELKVKTHALSERVKELNCLYRISDIMVNSELTFEETLQGTVNLIPPGWQYPEITCAKIKLDSHVVETANFDDSNWQQTSDISIQGKRIGTLVVGYLLEKPLFDEGPFLKEERSLITAIAEHIGNILQQKETDAALRKSLDESRQHQAEVSALLEGARAVLKNRKFSEAARDIFDHCKNLVGAASGYVVLMNQDGTENDVLFLDSGGLSCTVDPSAPMPIRGLRAEAYSQAKPVYTNEFSHSHWNDLLPPGRVDLENVLFAPMIIDGQPVGVLGLANKSGGFDENDCLIAAAFGELAAVALFNSRMLDSLQESEERFRSVVETAVEGIIVVDSRGSIQSWNNGAEKMFGYSAADSCSRRIDSIIPRRFLQAHNDAMNRAVAKGVSRYHGKTLNMTGLRKDGTEFPLELTLAIWRSQGEINVTAVIRDVTEKKRTEEELNNLNLELENRVKRNTAELRREIAERKLVEEEIRKSRSMLQAVFDGISDPLVLVDKAMKIKMMNEEARLYYGLYEMDTGLDRPCKECVGPAEMCADCQIPDMVLKGRKTTFERKGFNDSDRTEQVFVYPTKVQNGTGAIIHITDITEAKEFERQLIQSEKMASLGVLVSSIAHEINNPNNFVSFNIPILREYIESVVPYLDEYSQGKDNFELCNMSYPEFRHDIFKLLDNIENGSRRVSSFVANLREYVQNGPKKGFSWLDLALLIDKVLAIIQPHIDRSVKSFKKTISTNLPEIYSDQHAIEQIMINLLVNAAQAVDGAGSRIELNVIPSDEQPGAVVMEISDDGCGMDEATRSKIFDPFFTTKMPADGTGLGLYVCHQLIQGLGGRLMVESEPGQGSTFRLILPGKEAVERILTRTM